MEQLLLIFQIIISILLIIFVLLQQRGTALGSAFGGDGSGSTYSTRRGIQQKLYWATIICGALFIILAFLNLVI